MEDLNETRNCFKCNLNKPITQFRKYTNTLNSYSWTCKKCLNEKDKLRKKNIRRKKIENYIVKCEICNEAIFAVERVNFLCNHVYCRVCISTGVCFCTSTCKTTLIPNTSFHCSFIPTKFY